MAIRSKSSAAPAQLTPGAARDTYIPGDAIPVPEVIEKDSDSVWALWSDAVQGTTERDDETQPATLLMGLPELPKDRDH
jgi:aminoglycoside phosphotransferase